MYWNRATLIGKIVKPEGWPEAVRMQVSANGNRTSTFMVATNFKFGKYDALDLNYVIAFGKVAESCKEFLSEGSEVLVEARHSPRMVGPEGDKKLRCEFKADVVRFGDNVWSASNSGSADRQPVSNADRYGNKWG